MSPIRSILVHLDGTARAEVRLRIAHELAASHGAMLSALFAVAPLAEPFMVAGGLASIPQRDSVDPRHRESALALFEKSASTGVVASTWHELTGEPATVGFVQRALLADLLVLGQRNQTDASGFDVPADFVERVLIDSGKPALLVPYVGEATSAPQTVLVAWKPTCEAAHALTAALPFLRRAQHVHVVSSGNDLVDTPQAMAQLGQWLSWHGIQSVREHHGLAGIDAGNGLLSLAADTGAQLLVMGCYGHGRAHELILGGASRTVLQSMTLPVLMAH